MSTAQSPSASRVHADVNRRLPAKAAQILDDFRRKVSLNPTAEQRAELLSKIRRVPGAEYYTHLNMRDHFRGKRETRAKEILRNKGVLLNVGTKRHILSDPAIIMLLWPTLDEDKTQGLGLLNLDNPNPDEATLRIWSETLEADEEDIKTWLALHGLGSRTPSTPPLSRTTPETPPSSSTLHAAKPAEVSTATTSQFFPWKVPVAFVGAKPVYAPLKYATLPVEFTYPLTTPAVAKRPETTPSIATQNTSSASAQSAQFSAPVNGESARSTQTTQYPPAKSGPSTITQQLPVPQTSPPTRNDPPAQRLPSDIDLALFLESQLLPPDGSEELSLEELDEHLQASMAFFAKIQKGAYTSLGLGPPDPHSQ